jgi:MFS family permease
MQRLASTSASSLSVEEALELNPVGFFHYRLLLMCGLTFMTDALEVTLLAFLSSCAASEWQLSDAQEATLTAMVFLGIVVGSIFWGWFADKYGRRPAYLYSCAIIIAGGLMTAIAPSFELLVIVRAITGFGIGAASVPFDLLAEFMPSSHRGKFLVLTELFWTVGSMFVAGMAWLVLPSLGWRALAFTCALPVILVSTFSYFCLPESPRWLLSKNREHDANRVICESAAVNNINLPEFLLNDTGAEEDEHSSYVDLVATKSARRITFPLWIIWGLFGFTYYGLVLYVSRIYSSTHRDDGSDPVRCDFDYPPIFYNAASESVAILISAALIDLMGRKQSQSAFYALGGVAVMCAGFEWSPGWVLGLSILARMCSMSATVSACALKVSICCRLSQRRAVFLCTGRHVGDHARAVPHLAAGLGTRHVHRRLQAVLLLRAVPRAVARHRRGGCGLRAGGAQHHCRTVCAAVARDGTRYAPMPSL